MSDYDFHTLSPIDFENLIRDLLQCELSIWLSLLLLAAVTTISYGVKDCVDRFRSIDANLSLMSEGLNWFGPT